jgi:hypothetical protein
MNSNFNCSYMAMSSLTYILGFSVRFFSASLFRLGILCDKNHIKIFCSEIWVEMIFGWPTFKIMCNTPIFYQLRCQIENQVSDYRLVGASSFKKWASYRLYRKRPPRIVNRTVPKIIVISVHTVNHFPLTVNQLSWRAISSSYSPDRRV